MQGCWEIKKEAAAVLVETAIKAEKYFPRCAIYTDDRLYERK